MPISHSAGKGCPRLSFLPLPVPLGASASASSSTTLIEEAAYRSLREDNASNTDPRMVIAGRRFLECQGVDALRRLFARPEVGQHSLADDARQPRRALHRSAFPLSRFLDIHIADQPNRLGAAVGRRMKFEKLAPAQDRPSSRAAHLTAASVRFSTQALLGPRRRVRSAWHVSPKLFRLIMAFTSKMRKETQTPAGTRSGQAVLDPRAQGAMRGGRFLGKGKDLTRVYTLDDLAIEHPTMRGVCLHSYSNGLDAVPPRCFTGSNAGSVLRAVSGDHVPKRTAPTSLSVPMDLYGLALKDILDDQDAGIELQYHQRIHRWFTTAGCLNLTSLHPVLHYLQLDEIPRPRMTGGTVQTIMRPPIPSDEDEDGSGDTGRKLLVTRLLAGDAHLLSLREEELYDLSKAVLQGLVVFHDHRYLHMDIKPDNILWDLDKGGRRRFCLGDYNLMMSEVRTAHYLRPDDGGEFQSVTHGTPGFTSPLLMVDDASGSTYRKFHHVASKTRAFKKGAFPVWRDYFEKARATSDMAKLDLHSLALTLIQLVSRTTEQGGMTRLMRRPFGKFLAKLMFFRPQDLSTASKALEYLDKRSSALAPHHP